jgi:hypothetical protein
MSKSATIAFSVRTGVVVNAGALDAGPITLRGGIVDGEDQLVAGEPQHQRLDGVAEQARGRERRAASDGPENVVKAAELVGDAGGSEPGGDGAPALGQEGPQKQ